MSELNRKRGLITVWEDEKGYGFIEPAGGGERVFVHIKAFGQLQSRPRKGDVVLFVLGKDAKGRPRAERAEFVEESRERAKVKAPVGTALLPSYGFFGGVFGWSLLGGPPLFIPSLMLALSFITYLVYGLDKRKAEDSAWRVAESTLHLLSLLGGWPGAYAAQRLLRHKNRKPAFLAVFWCTVALNAVLLVSVFGPFGAPLIRMLAGQRP